VRLEQAIANRIDQVLADNDPKLEWVRGAVRQHGFLPLYLGWVAVLGIRPDGSFVRWGCEGPNQVEEVPQPFWQRMALSQGVKKYPELRTLLPNRPSIANTCDACSGTGEIRGAPGVVCKCGGTGWLIPGEAQDNSPG
jgi:hypothetical protein